MARTDFKHIKADLVNFNIICESSIKEAVITLQNAFNHFYQSGDVVFTEQTLQPYVKMLNERVDLLLSTYENSVGEETNFSYITPMNFKGILKNLKAFRLVPNALSFCVDDDTVDEMKTLLYRVECGVGRLDYINRHLTEATELDLILSQIKVSEFALKQMQYAFLYERFSIPNKFLTQYVNSPLISCNLSFTQMFAGCFLDDKATDANAHQKMFARKLIIELQNNDYTFAKILHNSNLSWMLLNLKNFTHLYANEDCYFGDKILNLKLDLIHQLSILDETSNLNKTDELIYSFVDKYLLNYLAPFPIAGMNFSSVISEIPYILRFVTLAYKEQIKRFGLDEQKALPKLEKLFSDKLKQAVIRPYSEVLKNPNSNFKKIAEELSEIVDGLENRLEYYPKGVDLFFRCEYQRYFRQLDISLISEMIDLFAERILAFADLANDCNNVRKIKEALYLKGLTNPNTVNWLEERVSEVKCFSDNLKQAFKELEKVYSRVEFREQIELANHTATQEEKRNLLAQVGL